MTAFNFEIQLHYYNFPNGRKDVKPPYLTYKSKNFLNENDLLNELVNDLKHIKIIIEEKNTQKFNNIFKLVDKCNMLVSYDDILNYYDVDLYKKLNVCEIKIIIPSLKRFDISQSIKLDFTNDMNTTFFIQENYNMLNVNLRISLIYNRDNIYCLKNVENKIDAITTGLNVAKNYYSQYLMREAD